MMRATLFALILALIGGCASVQSRPPVTIERVVDMTRQGTPPNDIIEEMRAAGTVYRLSGSQLAKLREQGVADEVLDYMQDTYLDEMQRRGRVSSYDPYWYGPYPGYAWAPYPYYWGAPYYYGPRYRHPRPSRPSAGGGSPGGGSDDGPVVRPEPPQRPAYHEVR